MGEYLNIKMEKQKKINKNEEIEQKHINKQLFNTIVTKTSGRKMEKSNISNPKEFIANNKEFRINENKYDLCIIGNNNIIKIQQNVGSVNIIGNETRVQIEVNKGKVHYLGNNGRIWLGQESQQKSVDYVGCNGTLVIIKWSAIRASKTELKIHLENYTQSSQKYKQPIVVNVGNIIVNNSTNVTISNMR